MGVQSLFQGWEWVTLRNYQTGGRFFPGSTSCQKEVFLLVREVR